MKNNSKLHLIILILVNLAVIIRLINIAWEGNDKGILITISGYLFLLLANTVIWIALRLSKHPAYKLYNYSTISLLILFIPVLALASLY